MRYVNLDLPYLTIQRLHGTYVAALVMRLQGYTVEQAVLLLATKH